MIVMQTLAKMVVPAMTVSINILARAQRDGVELIVKPVSYTKLIVVPIFAQFW